MRRPQDESSVRFRRNATRAALLLGIAVAAALALTRILPASAYEFYSTDTESNCTTCHGGFLSAGYVSAHDAVAWGLSLHDGHRNTDKMLNRDCDACHDAAGRFPVSLKSSKGGTGFAAIGCLGCHGRAEPAAGGLVTGAGLRQHHWRAGEQGCGAAGCHTDANPANFTTAAESVQPPYYFTPDAAHPLKPTSACNTNNSESAVAPPRGLDNNGNGSYDGLDPTCSATGVDPGTPRAMLALESLQPNPSFGRVRLTFVLASSRPASIDVLDVTGRRVMRQEVGHLGAGRHAMDLDFGRAIAPGMYMVRLSQDGRVLTNTAIVRR